jgi:hypothetical protein
MKPWSNKDFLAQRPFSTAHRAKPARLVRETGQAGFSLDSQEEHSPRVNSSKTKPRSPESLNGLEQDFGILGTPHEESIAKFNLT